LVTWIESVPAPPTSVCVAANCALVSLEHVVARPAGQDVVAAHPTMTMLPPSVTAAALTVNVRGLHRVEVTVYRQGLSAQYVDVAERQADVRLDAGFVDKNDVLEATNFPVMALKSKA